jgi:hypothetical protein
MALPNRQEAMIKGNQVGECPIQYSQLFQKVGSNWNFICKILFLSNYSFGLLSRHYRIAFKGLQRLFKILHNQLHIAVVSEFVDVELISRPAGAKAEPPFGMIDKKRDRID